MSEERIKLEADGDIVAAWKSGLAMGRRIGFDVFKQTCLSSAILELSRPVVERGEKGSCVITDESDPRMLRARVVIEGGGAGLAAIAKEKLNAEMNMGPWLPAVRLQQAVETCQVEEGAGRAKVSLTINQSRLASSAR